MDLNQLRSELKANNFDIEPSFSGTIQRFNREGNLNGWAIGEAISGLFVYSYGDWKTGEKFSWASENVEDSEAARTMLTAHREKAQKLREEIWEKVALDVEKLWDSYTPYGTHLYLEQKKLEGSLYGARVSGGNLFIPIRDINGKLWSTQKIGGKGIRKLFYPEGKISSCFHRIGDEINVDRIFIAEGFATGASIYLAFEKKWPVFCAMNAGNLENVALEVRRKYGEAEIIICADNDSGTKGNPGLNKAKRAAAEIGGKLVYPLFQSYDGNPTDFNDLHVREGLTRVRALCEASQGGAPEVIPLATKDKEGKKKRPPELLVVKALSEIHGDNVVQAGGDLYAYREGFWRLLRVNEINAVYAQIQKLSGNTYDLHHIKGAYQHFVTHVRDCSDQIFTPKPFAANFKNGTLHLEISKDYKYSFSFSAHNSADFITNILPLDYVENGKTNDEFELMLERVFKEETDGAEKRRSVSQMFGACVLPAFPHFFLLHGPGASGKSTIIKIAKNLVSDDNRCGVEPHEFKGFLMESMIGKLVNLVTDINVNIPIDDGNIKKVEDRISFRIDRKFKEAVYAPLPAIHIFGANDIPKTLNGSSGAHERRWTFLELKKFKASGLYNKDYDVEVFRAGPEGILRFAMEGLKDLLACRGHYLNPESGKETMVQWQLESDPIGQFLADIEAGLVERFSINKEAKTKQSVLWDVFCSWYDGDLKGRFRPGRNKFYASLKARGYALKKLDGFEYRQGIQETGKREVDTAHKDLVAEQKCAAASPRNF